MKCGLWILGMLLAGAAHADLPPSVLSRLQQAKLPPESLAMAIVPLNGERATWYQAEVPMSPASTMKLVTSLAALDVLGPTWQWQTEIRSTTLPENGVLSGDLYLKGAGDPKLTMERVWLLLRDLRARGVQDIQGDLVLDRSLFVLGQAALTIFPDEGNALDRPYMVMPDALSMNFKSVRIGVQAGLAGVQVTAEPPLPEILLENRTQLVLAADCATWMSRINVQVVEDAGSSARIVVSGNVPQGCSSDRYVSVLDHTTYQSSLIHYLWRELGGVWRGKVRLGTAPSHSVLLASSRSPELPLYLRDMNKYSNNSMARQLFLTLGAVAGQPEDGPDTAVRSSAVIQRWLLAHGHRYDELVLENGAGLSRQERICVKHLAELLVEAAHSPLAAEFVASLPIVAVDGTMKKRLLNDPVAGQAHIKTGSLKDVRSIAGYVRGMDGGVRVVVAILNHPRAAEGSAVLDEVLRVARTAPGGR